MKLSDLTQSPNFIRELQTLQKTHKHYSDIDQSLEAFFKDIDQSDALIESTMCITRTGGTGLHKVRISREAVGSSSGYRLYFLVCYPEKKVVLLSIYPKTGKLAKSNCKMQEIKAFIKEYNQSK